MPLPLTVSCFTKIQIGVTFLVPAHPGSPGKRAVKRLCACVCCMHLIHATYCYINCYTHCTFVSVGILEDCEKWLYQSWASIGSILMGPKQLWIRWRYTLAPPGKYDWMIHEQWQCGQITLTNFLFHTLSLPQLLQKHSFYVQGGPKNVCHRLTTIILLNLNLFKKFSLEDSLVNL